MFKYKLLKNKKGTYAHTGTITTNHGVFKTPIFMPPGTQATVKSLTPEDLKEIGIEILLVNTYHLFLRPGLKNLQIINKKIGDIHGFMDWPKPILSDSGGFQVWSLSQKKFQKGQPLAKITEEGVKFRSPLNGEKCFFTPELSMQTQHLIGSDIIMAFDECTPDNGDHKYASEAVTRTTNWAKRCLEENKKLNKHKNTKKQPALFGIIQGSTFKDLRTKSAQEITSLPFEGIALGGETIGYNMAKSVEIFDWVRDYLPLDKPVYMMGLGAKPQDIIDAVLAGADMFDCVSPARLARHGILFEGSVKYKKGLPYWDSHFKDGKLNIMNSSFTNDFTSIDKNCHCYTCTHFSKSYLRHLLANNELLYPRLATIHNLSVMLETIHVLRNWIEK